MTASINKGKKNSKKTQELMLRHLTILAARTAELNLALDTAYEHNLDVDEFAGDLSYAHGEAKAWLKKKKPAAGVMSARLSKAIAYAKGLLEEVDKRE